MQKLELKYEGKAKRVWHTEQSGAVIIEYLDAATAFNAKKRGTIPDKGMVNNRVSAHLYPLLEEAGIPTHFRELLSDTEQLVHDVEIIPVEVIVRLRAAGSFSERLDVAEGTELAVPVVEYCYKSDELGDPLVSDSTPQALGWASEAELAVIRRLALQAAEFLAGFFRERDIDLIDMKFEFGRLPDGRVVLADEISPDTTRLWDARTAEKLDKDRFRRDLGGVGEAYRHILEKVLS
ncbi:MAG TPA: phosphoribosylaminoimidazolesuccinocarboxamide synthase [Deinococcales bacterium]|nr:phosphoribosylaminoimidazolesuccinocarboxamide synthase [Deinococcales bacterium]